MESLSEAEPVVKTFLHIKPSGTISSDVNIASTPNPFYASYKSTYILNHRQELEYK